MLRHQPLGAADTRRDDARGRKIAPVFPEVGCTKYTINLSVHLNSRSETDFARSAYMARLHS